MTIRMARLRREKSGRRTSRKAIPEDVRGDYQVMCGRGWEEIFRLGPDHSAQRAKLAFSEWQADIDSRMAMRRGESQT
jgi:hypothetical protein